LRRLSWKLRRTVLTWSGSFSAWNTKARGAILVGLGLNLRGRGNPGVMVESNGQIRSCEVEVPPKSLRPRKLPSPELLQLQLFNSHSLLHANASREEIRCDCTCRELHASDLARHAWFIDHRLLTVMAASLGETSLADVHHEGLDQVSKGFP
jgi:hypothetical protein